MRREVQAEFLYLFVYYLFMRKTNIGGQALIEGVMMKGTGVVAMAVRDERGNIRLETTRTGDKRRWWSYVPIVRGVVAFFDAMINGTRMLMRSSEVFMEEGGKTATDKKEKGTGWFIFLSLLLGILLAVGLFFLLPNLLTDLVVNGFGWKLSPFVKNLIDGVLRLAIFLLYMVAVTKVKDVRRVFMYHGAEHKTINCYEHELPLTVENVRNSSRIHDRCGTSFMFLVMFISVLVFSFVGWNDNAVLRLLLRLALLPVVAGLSYEVLKLLAKSDSKWLKPIKAPGAWLQKALTTKEPDDSMIEVAIASFDAVLRMTEDKTIPEQKFPVTMPLGEYRAKAAEYLLSKGVDEPSDIDWILCDVTGLKRSQLKDNINITPYMQIKAEGMLERRAQGEPLQYILGDTEFYGYKFSVNKNVLIPRFETELLVDKTLPYIDKDDRVLDLCCGSGAIGITVRLKKGCEVVLGDVSEGALEVAKKNAATLGADVKTVLGDMFENIDGVFDVIICNPPYIPTADIASLDDNVKNHEPTSALDGGADGLDFYRRLAKEAPARLKDGGILALELGAGQMEDVKDITAGAFDVLAAHADYNGIDRILILTKKDLKG